SDIELPEQPSVPSWVERRGRGWRYSSLETVFKGLSGSVQSGRKRSLVPISLRGGGKSDGGKATWATPPVVMPRFKRGIQPETSVLELMGRGVLDRPVK